MAVQAQYPSNAFRVRSNGLEEFQYRENVSGNLFGGYNNYVGQHILNGTVFSDPESELTCNVSGSRKRSRDDQMVLTQHQQQQHQQQMLQSHQPQVLPQFRFSNFPKDQVFDTTATAAAISTSLQLSYEENRLNGSGGTSTSGRSSAVSHSVSSPLAQDLNSHLLHQNFEIDALILLHNDKLRSLLEETRKRHCRSLLSVLEQKVLNRLQEKETELENASRRNAELEEKLKQMSAENQIWFNVAKNNEALVSSLKSSLEEILLQNKGQIREGFGDSDGVTVVADDAQSCCYEGAIEEDKTAVTEKTIRENHELKQRKACKVCHENEVSVLLLPCRHLCLCKNCELKIVSCPICKSTKNASLQIFVS